MYKSPFKSNPARPSFSGLLFCVLAIGLLWSWVALIAHPGGAKGLGGAGSNHPLNSSDTELNYGSPSPLLGHYEQFYPPDNGQKHRILVIDEEIWGFVTVASHAPREFLAQTPYALGPHDWVTWTRPVQTEFDEFYVLLIIRHKITGPNERWVDQIPQSIIGSTDRLTEEIEINQLVYQYLIRNNDPNPYGWNVYATPEHSLQNILVITPYPVVYELTTEVFNGQTIIKTPGLYGLTREFRVLTKIDGLAVDNQAVSSQTVNHVQTKVVAISIEYNSSDAVPEWQRPLLVEMAGIDSDDWYYVNHIIHHESRWEPRAKNPSSGAYGLCQSLPARKMKSAGDDYQSNAITQLKWCHSYAQKRYGGWEQAYRFWRNNRWW